MPWVPTGMKIGVCTDPCGKSKRPQRADVEGSVESRVKDTGTGPRLVDASSSAKPNPDAGDFLG